MALQVSFYSDAEDPLHYACRLIRRALASGKPVGVCVAPDDAARLDGLLWNFDATDFIPHRRWDGEVSPAPGEVLLVADAASLPHRSLLLNLSDDMPSAALEFERVSRLPAGWRQAGPFFSGELTTSRPRFPE
ncbi:MAG: DNA polymerase III subunit chi [Burkholderiales bacterium]|nr:DNA polymerase III subunit chi [Burkholderiales bacterium]